MNNFSLKHGPSTADEPNIGNGERDWGSSCKQGKRRSFSHQHSIWHALSIRRNILAVMLISMYDISMVRADDLEFSSYTITSPSTVSAQSDLLVTEV